jgi:hypothetical protein
LRLELAQIGLTTVVAALALLVAVPRGWLGAALLGLIPLALARAYQRWRAYREWFAGPDNVHLDPAGLHWIDAAGRRRSISRGEVVAFRIASDEDTLRPVPALTLYLAGGFESQPIELHPPATLAALRRILVEEWRLPEREPAPEGAYDALVAVYSECHDEWQEWHWEGSRAELRRLFELIAEAAEQLPLPPPGARPARRVVLAQRRAPSYLSIAHSPKARLGHDRISGPAGLLRELAARAAAALDNLPRAADAKFELPLGPHDRWTFHLHIRD